MLDNIFSLQTETIVLLIALGLALINALVAAIRKESWMKLGKKSITAKNFEAAIQYFTKEIELHPKNGKAYQERAEAYRLNEEPLKALSDRRMANALKNEPMKKVRTSKPNGTLLSSLR